MNAKLFNPNLTADYNSPKVETLHTMAEGVLCGSFNGAQIPGYGDEDIWSDN